LDLQANVTLAIVLRFKKVQEPLVIVSAGVVGLLGRSSTSICTITTSTISTLTARMIRPQPPAPTGTSTRRLTTSIPRLGRAPPPQTLKFAPL
jgi:hypothetical protein